LGIVWVSLAQNAAVGITDGGLVNPVAANIDRCCIKIIYILIHLALCNQTKYVNTKSHNDFSLKILQDGSQLQCLYCMSPNSSHIIVDFRMIYTRRLYIVP
jgi:hypothetical protein